MSALNLTMAIEWLGLRQIEASTKMARFHNHVRIVEQHIGIPFAKQRSQPPRGGCVLMVEQTGLGHYKRSDAVTAGAALSHMDLALWLVRSVSPQLAFLTAKYLIADSRTSQSVYALSDHLMHSDPIVHRFESWARGRLTRGFSLYDAAKAVGASKRTLARRMETVLGKSPLSYFQSLRVERAVHLLKTTNASVEEVAVRVGYADGATLRVLLRSRLNLGVKEIRRSL